MPIFLMLFVSLIIALQIILKMRKPDFDSTLDEIRRREMEANITTKRKIDDSIFITAYCNNLPFHSYPDTPEYKKLNDAQELVKNKSKLKMVHFNEPITTTDLKLTYGLNNLEMITTYEEHFNSYVSALVNWASLLYEKGNSNEAEIILNESLKIGCDLKLNYTLLADIYYENGSRDKLNTLKETAENSRMLLKPKIIDYINKKLSEI